MHLQGSGFISPSLRSLRPFNLYRPDSVEEARQILTSEPEAIVASGCSDLVAQIREGLTVPALMSVRRIPELREIRRDSEMLRLGATVTHQQGSSSAKVREAIPGLASAWGSIATVRVRSTATVGGNLMARRHRYEMALILGALDARLRFHTADTRAVDTIWQEPGAATALLEAIEVPLEGLVHFAYDRSMRPITTLALALHHSDAGLRVTAVAGSEYRPGYHLIVATPATRIRHIDIDAVTTELADQLPPESADYAGGLDYRRHLVKVLTGRMLSQATLKEDQ